MSLTFLFKLSVTYSKGHPLQKFLLFLGIAIGVAVVVAVDLANDSIGRSFQLSTQSIAGKATHQVSGSGNGLEQSLYAKLQKESGLVQMAPVITGYVQIAEFNRRTLQLLGVDPLVDSDFRNYLGETEGLPDQAVLISLLTVPNRVLLAKSLADEFQVKAGDTLTLHSAAGTQEVMVAGLLSSPNSFTRQALSGVLLADIATAQEILRLGDRISHIDLMLDPEDMQLVTRIKSLLPEGNHLVSKQQSNQTIRQMSKAFELNLSALSLLALLVGMFLIYNTITFSVIQRRYQLGTLRALGMTQGEVMMVILGETLFWGLLGTITGILLGIALGTGLIRLVSQTITDLYFTLTVNTFHLGVPQVIKAFLLGILASLFSAVFPAWEAARINPVDALRRSSLERKIGSSILLLTCGGLATIGLGFGLLLIATRSLGVSFGALLLIVCGSAMLVPMATLIALRLVCLLFSLVPGITPKIASRNLGRSLSRTGVAIASLMIAVSVIVGVGTMVGSFRSTVVAWLSNTIRSDLYLRPANDLGAAFDIELKELLAGIEGVDQVFSIRTRQIAFGPYANAAIVVLDRDTAKREWLWQIAGQPELDLLFEKGWVYVSEPFAWKHRIREQPGNILLLDTDDGPKPFPVAGIFRDFSSEQGIILMSDRSYRQFWHDTKVFGLSLLLKPQVEPAVVQKRIETTLGNRYGIAIRSNQGLRNAAIEVFDRTFTITLALQILAGLVAFIGVLNTVMSLLLERSREIGVLRANGMTLLQLWRMVLLESGLIGLLSGLFALPLGTLMAWILVFIINKRSFGWTLDFVFDSKIYLQAVAVALIAALLAGIYPVATLVRKPVADLLRME